MDLSDEASQFAIESVGIRKVFGDKVAVDDFSLQVPKGEVFGFLGPNGAGKTTSVKMLLGLIIPTDGTASILGKPIGERSVLARVGFLPEHFRFHEWLRAAEFLDLHGQLLGMEKARRAVAIPRLLELVGLERRSTTKLSAFSKGMLQRIGLAQALLNDPELVFLDEPTSGLDPLGRRLVRDIIRSLREEQITIFLNSHLLSEIELTCDRVAFIREGRIVRVARLDELEQGQLQITLRVGQPTAELLAELAHFGDDVTMDPNSGRIHLTLTGEKHIPELARWLVAEGHEVYELSPRHLSLEDQFLEIIGDEMYDS
jgi:ABC-2 type transport system ATP-binding protein